MKPMRELYWEKHHTKDPPISEYKKLLKSKMTEKWNALFQEHKHNAHYKTVIHNSTIPESIKDLPTFQILSNPIREWVSAVIQLRTRYLFGEHIQWRAGYMSTNKCQCSLHLPTIIHYIFECPRNAEARSRSGIPTIISDQMDPSTIHKYLGTKGGISKLILFVSHAWKFIN